MATEISDLRVLHFVDIKTLKADSFEEAKKLYPGLTINKNNSWGWGRYFGIIGHGKKDENRWGIVGIYDLKNPLDIRNFLYDIEYYSNIKEETNPHDF